MKKAFSFILGLIALVLSVRSLPARAEAASTPACGSISVDTTWHAADSPIEVCAAGVAVAQGATLTIEPGVSVQFANSPSNLLTVQGALSAIGTPTQPITFTGVVATPVSWGGLSINGLVGAPASLSLDYAVLEYGGINGSYGGQIYVDRGQISIAHSLIRNSAGNGVYASYNAAFRVDSTNFLGNGLSAMLLSSPSVDLQLSGLSASGNGTDGIRLAGTVTMPGQRHWFDPGIPYIVDAPLSNVQGDMLTLDPGGNI